ncbi:hypothetical protein F441_21635 [Phytophthora nicotianae CJ01A1]|uniref:Uncharacterized protein n=4 Tax=Phytophthora nicotianae TaxID=4792 RepID=W2QV09_PHYN3|nr:hypothetical protein PPTG_21895 [Phytophthora nicotianae INRA-310]ETI31271.1 hypothetical protein F443_21748 [Phytophthora nicotianae P1569]ETN16294.1 hypothetical protein PPTG_21895 [Phytophthora nicotianae INRA-310]ETP01037.1 hypothetical protein F441_21635 [Phytophthora nicotianae CJ01A1]ETP29246.1 hypothetical protein F442_21609 [Phytophthora nicotianae P10297]
MGAQRSAAPRQIRLQFGGCSPTGDALHVTFHHHSSIQPGRTNQDTVYTDPQTAQVSLGNSRFRFACPLDTPIHV